MTTKIIGKAIHHQMPDTIACLAGGLTVLEYARQNADARCEEDVRAMLMALQSVALPVLPPV